MKIFIISLFLSTVLYCETLGTPSGTKQHEIALTAVSSVSKAPSFQDLTDVTIWGPSRTKRFCLSGGFSSDFRNEGYLGAKGMFEYKMWPRVTLGLEAGVYVNNTSFQGKRTMSSGVRGSYQLIPFDRAWSRRPWSIYAGVGGGALFGAGDKEIEEVDPYVDLHAGARYRISRQWMLHSELTSRTATLGLSLIF